MHVEEQLHSKVTFYLDTYYHTETMLREEICLSVLDADNLAELTQAVFKSLNMESK